MSQPDRKITIPVAAGLLGLLLPALLSLGVFATKADLADLRTDVATSYARKEDVERGFDKLASEIRRIGDRIDKLLEGKDR